MAEPHGSQSNLIVIKAKSPKLGANLLVVEIAPMYGLTRRVIDVDFLLGGFAFAGGWISAACEDEAHIVCHIQEAAG